MTNVSKHATQWTIVFVDMVVVLTIEFNTVIITLIKTVDNPVLSTCLSVDYLALDTVHIAFDSW